MERISKGIPVRPVGADVETVMDRQVLPVLRELRAFANNLAPSGEVELDGDDLHVDVLFSKPEKDAEYVVVLAVLETEGTPPPASVRARVERRDIYGFRVRLQYRPGSGNSVRVGWGLRR